MPNNRIFYAIQALGLTGHLVTEIAASGTPRPGKSVPSGTRTAHGVQTVGLSTTFNLEQVFELGQLDLYENIEGIPDIELTAQKVLDGYPLLYHLATPTALSATLVGRSNERAYATLNIYPDTLDFASGTPLQAVGMSGMYVSAISYTLNVDGNSTEDITLVGNDKEWFASGIGFLPESGADPFGSDDPLSLPLSGGVQRRENVKMGPAGSTWPKEIPGIDAGTGKNLESGEAFLAHIQTVTISTDLGREELFELGRRGPYHRFVSFPVEVTTAIDITSSEGDLVDALADPGGTGENLVDQTIRILMDEGTDLNLGSKNKLASVTYGGGDAGGGNVTVTYNYSNFNILEVNHPQDPAPV